MLEAIETAHVEIKKLCEFISKMKEEKMGKYTGGLGGLF